MADGAAGDAAVGDDDHDQTRHGGADVDGDDRVARDRDGSLDRGAASAAGRHNFGPGAVRSSDHSAVGR